MKLSNRIKYLIKEVLQDSQQAQMEDGTKVCYYDIGCDHGKVGCELLKENATCKVAFCDISEVNLDKAKCCILQLCKDGILKHEDCEDSFKYFMNRSSFYCCNGVPKILNKCNDSKLKNIGLIFGLGGETIKNIIQNDNSINEFYLQPATSLIELREFLYNGHFKIYKDYLFCDGKNFYDFIHIERLNKNANEFKLIKSVKLDEKLLGKDNLGRKDCDYQRFLIKQKHNLGKVLAKTNKNMLQLNVDKEKIETYRYMYDLINRQIEGE